LSPLGRKKRECWRKKKGVSSPVMVFEETLAPVRTGPSPPPSGHPGAEDLSLKAILDWEGQRGEKVK